MPKFYIKQKKMVFVIKSAMPVVIPNEKGIPIVVNVPGKTFTIENGVLDTEDTEIIERLRKDSKYGTEDLREVTREDEEIIKIRNRKLKEAEEEIAGLKK